MNKKCGTYVHKKDIHPCQECGVFICDVCCSKLDLGVCVCDDCVWGYIEAHQDEPEYEVPLPSEQDANNELNCKYCCGGTSMQRCSESCIKTPVLFRVFCN